MGDLCESRWVGTKEGEGEIEIDGRAQQRKEKGMNEAKKAQRGFDRDENFEYWRQDGPEMKKMIPGFAE